MKTIFIMLCIAAFGIVGRLDLQDEQAQRDLYCEMVEIWKADEARDVRAEDRSGWPPFDGECSSPADAAITAAKLATATD